MPSLIFTTLLRRNPEFSSPSSPSDAAIAQKESVYPAISLPTVLAIAGAFVALILISYGAYRFIKYRQCEKRSSCPSLRRFFLRGDSVHSQPHDVEKGPQQAKVHVENISGPTLLFGTGSMVLNNPVIINTGDIGLKKVAEPHHEHEWTAPSKEVCDATPDAVEIRRNVVDDTVSRNLVEDTQIGSAQSMDIQNSSESKDTPKSDSCIVSKREVSVLSDASGLEGVGITKADVDALKGTEDQCKDEVSVRAKAIATLTVKFEAFESLGEEAYLSRVKSAPFEEPHSIDSSLSSSSINDNRSLDSADTSFSAQSTFDSSDPTIPKSGQLVPCWRSLKSKEDAETTLKVRRVDMQRSPELQFVILNPTSRDLRQFRPATAPFNYEYAPMSEASIQKLERCTFSRGKSMKHKSKTPSPLASSFVICGPGCMPKKDIKLKKALRRLVSTGIKVKDVPTSRATICSPPVPKPAIVVVDKGSSSALFVEVLRRVHRRKADRETLLALVSSFVEGNSNNSPLTLTPSPAVQQSHPHAAAESCPAPTMDAVSSRSSAVSASRARLIATKARPLSPPRAKAARSSPESRMTTSTYARLSTVVEEQEDSRPPLPPHSPTPMIDSPRTRNLGRVVSPATSTVLPNKSSPVLISRMPATSRSSPIPATSARIAPYLDRSSESTRVSALPPSPMRNASSRSSTSSTIKIPQALSAPVSKSPRANRVSLSDVTNSKSAPAPASASTSKSERRRGSSQPLSKPPQSAPVSVSTSKASSVNHARKSSKSNLENLLLPTRSPSRTLVSKPASPTLASSRRASAMKPAFRI